MMDIISANCRFGVEPKQAREGCQRIFRRCGRKILVLCDWVEEDYPIGVIRMTPSGITIEISATKEEVPVTIVRKTVVTG